MVSLREDELVIGSKKGPVSASMRARWLALPAFVVGCSADPNVHDPGMDDTPAATTTPQPSEGTVRGASQASQACRATRTPITEPDGALLDTLDRLESEILTELDPPLNLAKVSKTPLRQQLSVLRKKYGST